MAKRGQNEGSIYKRPDGRWCAAMSIESNGGGKPKRKAFYGTTRAAVERKLSRARTERQQGLPVANERLTVAAFLQTWLEQTGKNVRPRTIESYRFIVAKHIAPALGSILLSKLSPNRVQQFLIDALLKKRSERKKGAKAEKVTGTLAPKTVADEVTATLSPRTVQLMLAVLRKALQQAVRWNLVARNVASREFVDGPRVERKRVQPFNPAEAKTLLLAARGDRLEALYIVALSLGLREGEVLGLQWSDIDLDARRLRVSHTLQRLAKQWVLASPKTEQSRRTIMLPTSVAEALRKHRTRQLEERLAAGELWNPWTGGDLVFVNENGTPLHPKTLLTRYHALLVTAKLPRRRFHDTRHSAASILLAQGVQPKAIQEILGHTEIRTTLDVYGHLFADTFEQAATAMESALFSG